MRILFSLSPIKKIDESVTYETLDENNDVSNVWLSGGQVFWGEVRGAKFVVEIFRGRHTPGLFYHIE